jgi:hypothetical protein
MKYWWTSWLILLVMVLSPSIAIADRPVPPPPDTAIGWDVHRSLGIILEFKTDQGMLYFAHSILITQLVSECRGVTWSEDAKTVGLMETDTTGVPSKYTIMKEPIAYRWGTSDKWESMLAGRYNE